MEIGEKPLVHSFRTLNNCYVYDVYRNSLLEVPACMEKYFHGNMDEDQLNEESRRWLEQARIYGFFLPKPELQIDWSISPQIIQEQLLQDISMITLQVTQGCNLRCTYCSYNGESARSYERSHSSMRMDRDTAFAGIDYLMTHSARRASVAVGFYGGEPLLEFDLIRECVEYITTQYASRTVLYNVTTNGTLLDETMMKFFEKHEFRLLISLDGPKSVHDLSRKTIHGVGSYSKVHNTISVVRQHYPQLYKQIALSVVIPPGVDAHCYGEWIRGEDEVVDGVGISNVTRAKVSVKQVVESAGGPIDRFSLAYFLEYFRGLRIGESLPTSMGAQMIERVGTQVLRGYAKLGHPRSGPETMVGGTCVPGAVRLMLSAEGVFYPCERVSEEYDLWQLGTIKTGIQSERVQAFISGCVDFFRKRSCLNCWAWPLCTICPAAMLDDDPFLCERLRSASSNDLRTICLLYENSPTTYSDAINA